MGSEKVDAVLRLREAGRVERCHTLPHYLTYSIGQHVYDMLALLVALHPNPSAALFRAVVLHDAHERIIGDIPGAIKEAVPACVPMLDQIKTELDEKLGYVVALSSEEKQWLKAVDRIEFLLWTEDQVAMGNRHIAGRLDAVKLQLSTTPMPEPCQEFLRNFYWHRTPDKIG